MGCGMIMGEDQECVFGPIAAKAIGLKTRTTIYLCWLGIMLFGLASFGHAAPVDDAIRQQQQIQQQQEQRRQELEREHMEELNKPPSTEDLRVPAMPEAGPDAPCFEAKIIEISGVSLLDSKTLEGLKAPYLGRCLTFNDVNNLVRDVTNAYIDRGYVTARAAIPEQDFSSGKLLIVVVEGKVEAIEFKDNVGRPQELKGAFPGLVGKHLNLRDIEQGLDQMNRLPSSNAKMELVPGEDSGGSRVVVSKDKGKTWRASFGLDNSGQESTGRNQYVLAFAKDNLLGINDLLNFTMNGDSDAWLTGEHQKSVTFNTFYSVPVGYWTFSGSISHFDYRTSISSAGTENSSAGDTTTTSLTVDRVIHRDQNSKTSLDFVLTHRDIQNYFRGARLATSSQVLSALGADLNHNHRLLGGVVSAKLGFIHGVPILGAKRDKNPARDEPRAQFSKTTFYGSYQRPFQINGIDMAWVTNVSGQWSPHTLYSAEQFSIGSRYTVRGFHDDSLVGDTGGYMRNELTLNLPNVQEKYPVAHDWLGNVQLYAGYDAGVIRHDRKSLEEKGSLQGAVIGLRSLGGHLLMDFAVSRPLDAPAFLQHREIEFYSSFKYSY